MNRLIAALVLASSMLAHAEDPKPKPKNPKFDLGLPTFQNLPSSKELQKPKEKEMESKASNDSAQSCYSVVRVVHGKSFKATPQGSEPSSPFSYVPLSGNPPYTEKFMSSVRMACPTKRGGAIEVAIVDTRGDIIMTSRGQLSFGKVTEAEWQVVWDPTPMREGDYQFVVHMSGELMGSFPIRIGLPPEPPKPAQ